MTHTQTLAAIKALGLTARRTDGEYRISFNVHALANVLNLSYKDAQAKNEAMAYYTDCQSDALDTARAMKAAHYALTE